MSRQGGRQAENTQVSHRDFWGYGVNRDHALGPENYRTFCWAASFVLRDSLRICSTLWSRPILRPKGVISRGRVGGSCQLGKTNYHPALDADALGEGFAVRGSVAEEDL